MGLSGVRQAFKFGWREALKPLVSFMAEMSEKNSHSQGGQSLVNSIGSAGVVEGAPPERHLVNESPTRDVAEVGYNSKVEGDVVVTRTDAVLNWFRKNSLWPMPMGLACCAIELMAAGASRYDISRFGSEVMRFSPRQSDLMIVAGTVTYKMAVAVKRID